MFAVARNTICKCFHYFLVFIAPLFIKTNLQRKIRNPNCALTAPTYVFVLATPNYALAQPNTPNSGLFYLIQMPNSFM